MFLIAPFIWGILEASYFFMVPDVAISFVALKLGLKKGLMAALIAAIGAAIGGQIIYFWALHDFNSLVHYMDNLPAISADMIRNVGVDVAHGGYYGKMFIGAFGGIPYKIFASFASVSGISWYSLLIMTPIIRLPRFIAVATITHFIKLLFPKDLQTSKLIYILLALVWVINYSIYWTIMPN